MDPIGPIVLPFGIPVDVPALFRAIGSVITAAWTIAGIVAVAMIIYGGYSIMIATGDPQKLKKGQDTLAYAVVGLIIVIVSGVLLRYIAVLLGVEDAVLKFKMPFK